MRREWSARPYQEGDEEKIHELWQAVYPSEQRDRDSWMRWWRWMYKENPLRTSTIWLAEDNGRIVGQYAIVPVMVTIADKTRIAAQSVDTMTHPDYRHRGIFETLAKEVYKEASSSGISIVYGFPNAASYPGFVKKLNWFDVAHMQMMLKPIDWRDTVRCKVRGRLSSEFLAIGAALIFGKLLFRARKAPEATHVAINRISAFDERFDRLWDRVSSRYPLTVARTMEYLNWRFCTADRRHSVFAAEKGDEVSGYCVIGRGAQEDRKMDILLDLIAESGEVMDHLISEATRDCDRSGTDFIVCDSIANKAYLRILRMHGFIPLPFLKGPRFCAYSSSTQLPQSLLKEPANWFVQLGDSDIL